ncbi:dioxygenase [Hahella sp. CCB-MM4]|uniref:DODA-type extradiol aromatic ring-opening family dioxygenase n=1 Tax=Hahella sp. (strain CCB-MM4) TaxID=1926491 RepID=UPI000B9C64AC|nr:class III extradiol ring-cleavage dioxygenase [Hahella sp. CCB-MM4]OZG74875.1 dioxygenase [Hahella sp. CCB-MM4]
MACTNEISAAPVLFLSHGGGPLPLLGHSGHAEMVRTFEKLRTGLPPSPAAIILISAHWEAQPVEVTGGATPSLIYDYYGFPPESYGIKYPALGKPELATAVSRHLNEQGIPSQINGRRGFDHGMFIPLRMLYPKADIPVVQLSLDASLDPGLHVRVGRALREFRAQNIMIIGSGFSFHNLSVFFSPKTPTAGVSIADFTQWLDAVMSGQELSEEERTARLEQWEQAPSARFCHPREEHLLPLHCCFGASGSAVSEIYSFKTMGVESRCYLWNT